MLPETAAAFKMTAPTFKLFTNKTSSPSLRHCVAAIAFSFQSAKLHGVGFPGDAVTNFLVTFQHVNVAR